MSKKYKISQNGGYLLTSKKEGHLLNIMEKHYEKYGSLFGIGTEPKPIAELDERIKIMSSPEYLEIYKKLMDIYFDDTQYYQNVSKDETKMIDDGYANKIHPYHLNFGALMFINYLVEHELFALLYTIIPCKTESNDIDNGIHPRFIGDLKYDLPYKNYVYNNPVMQINLFANRLDKIFQYFMEDLVSVFADEFRAGEGDIYHDMLMYDIVMLEHSEHISDKFDYINVNWKDRIVDSIYDIENSPKEEIKIKINKVLLRVLSDFLRKYFEYDATLGGFYDVVNRTSNVGKASGIGSLYPQIIKRIEDKTYGSCITSSLLEMYILTRLHVNGNHISLLLENAAEPITSFHPDQHLITGLQLGIVGLTHYATKIGIHVSATVGEVLMRSFSKNEPARLLLDLPFATRKVDIFRAITYIAGDNTIEYFTIRAIQKPKESEELKMMMYLRECLPKFILERMRMFEARLSTYKK